jgi:hypothetical protein
MERSDSGVGTEEAKTRPPGGPSLNEFDEDTGQTTTGDLARGISRYGHIGESRETVGHWGFKDDGRPTGRGRRTTNWTRTTNRTRKTDNGR